MASRSLSHSRVRNHSTSTRDTLLITYLKNISSSDHNNFPNIVAATSSIIRNSTSSADSRRSNPSFTTKSEFIKKFTATPHTNFPTAFLPLELQNILPWDQLKDQYISCKFFFARCHRRKRKLPGKSNRPSRGLLRGRSKTLGGQLWVFKLSCLSIQNSFNYEFHLSSIVKFMCN